MQTKAWESGSNERMKGPEASAEAKTEGGELRVAVVGAGYWGKNLVRNFASLERCRLATVCDTDPKVRERVEREHPGVHVTSELEEVLADPDIDAVALVTPAVSHASQALKAIDARKHVYVEKPLALSVEDGREVVRRAEESDRTVMVGHMLCYHPVVRQLKEMVSRGELGELFYMYALRVNLGRLRSDENALWSFGPHDLSVMLYLIEELPETVAARGKAFLQKGIEDVVFVNLSLPSGAMAQIQLSWLDPRKTRKLTIVGSRKMVEFDDVEPVEKLRIFDKGFSRPPDFESYGEYLSIRHGDVLIPRVDMTEPLKVELTHFVECCLEGRRPVTDARGGYEVVRILEAASRSMDRGGAPVRLREVER